MCINEILIRSYGTIFFVNDATQFLKNSFEEGFYFNLTEEFKKNDKYVDFAHETKKRSDGINEKFKGVQVIRHKEKNKIYSISSHGTFTRKPNKEIRTSFNSAWKPEQRWTPSTIIIKERKICRGWKASRSGDIYNEVYRGFDVKNLTPYNEIYKFLLKIWEKKKDKKDKEHPDNTTPGKKRVQLRGNIDYKKIPELLKINPKIYEEVIDFDELIIDRFNIDESDKYFTPLFFSEVIRNYFKRNIDEFILEDKK